MVVRVRLGTPYIEKEKILKDNLQKFLNLRQFHICIIFIFIISILFIVGVISLIYSVEGENHLPFQLSKIVLISTIEGIDIEDTTNRWNLDVNQNNDIYLYIKKNEQYEDTEIIESIKLDNFNFIKAPKVGSAKILKPDSNMEGSIFKNTKENEVNNIEFIGSMDSSIKELKISNQGGLVIFRYAIDDLGNYISNEDEQINHNELLKNEIFIRHLYVFKFKKNV